MKIKVDKIGSCTKNVKLQQEVILSPDIISNEGYIIAIRILTEKTSYNTVELTSGRMSKVCQGDILVGVLGARHGLRAYCGTVPERLSVGDKINVLSLAAVLGNCTGYNPEIGKPFEAEVLGAVLHFPSFTNRLGEPAHILSGPVKIKESLTHSAPLVIVSGACMESGKTRATCEIIKQLSKAGKKVAAGKLTGISRLSDTLNMTDFGAFRALSFVDAGIVSTNPSNVLSVAKGLVHELSQDRPDCIVLELGDGIMGEYGVMQILNDKELMFFVQVHVFVANDHVGAWGAVHYLKDKCPTIDVVCGPVTDNEVGVKFVEKELQLKAANAIKDGARLGQIVLEKLATYLNVENNNVIEFKRPPS